MIDALGLMHLNVIMFDDLNHDIILCESSLSDVLLYIYIYIYIYIYVLMLVDDKLYFMY